MKCYQCGMQGRSEGVDGRPHCSYCGVADPDGWRLVPVKPTQEMRQQGQWKAREWPKFPLRISEIYAAMVDAAPKPGDTNE